MAKRHEERASLTELRREMRRLADPERAKNLARFFKTGAGDYGEGDRFTGLTMPLIREVARAYRSLGVRDIERLLRSRVHEERMLALIIMTLRYAGDTERFYRLYLKNIKYVNNWDLVDVTCPRIVGDYLVDRPRDILYTFARSKNLWERRIAIIATSAFIARGDFADTFKISEILLRDTHDLIHKAVGWMLREVGKRDKKVEVTFLAKHHAHMPRTMLRYAIERFPELERKRYLKKG